ncbi:hypothetical protein [Bifidobacterium callitrichidarum]|uniref:Uncharacterized protein n=1 Tax=Bifidobacterium callitrichidarum TaxID=2052941 RepID=A0A2U2N0L2_9BIFI|nr:hypothetical protein [Bifidobacterium callitrichidarum]PWG62660.1 hypothetical protein DF196_11925 [Bifidobacterium callitrichidarum]
MARHKATHTKTGSQWTPARITAIPVAVVLLLIGYLWFAPASIIPIPMQEQSCVVTDGGTLRVHTTKCGTLYVRGHVDLEAWAHYKVKTTGNLAWSFEKES